MYRIRRQTGGEVTLASLDELAAAIVAGTVNAEAEIHHQRADRWLPIASHPHFKLASERASSAVRPAPKAAPVPPASTTPAGSTTPPTLRLVRSDMGTPATATPESKPVSRWTPPQRPPAAPPRGTGSAVAAAEASSQLIEFVAETTAVPAPAAEPVRPKRVEPATAGLPMLDIEMPQPQRPMRSTPPMSAPITWPTMHTKPRPEPVAPKAPAPVTPAPTSVVMAPAPTPVTAAAPVASVEVLAPTPEPAAPLPVAVAAPAAPEQSSSMPWQVPEDSLDVPLPIRDFGERVEAAAATEPELADPGPAESEIAFEVPSTHSTRSRWPMYIGAAAVLGAIALFALRPRAEVESLAPKPTAPVASKLAPAGSDIAVDAQAASMRPQITPIVPPGPSPELSAPSEPVAAPVVPAAPRVKNMLPANAVDDLDLQVDPIAEQRQRALEETRRDIQTQMQR